MEYDVFEEPIHVFLGLGIPRPIRTVQQAYAVLNNIPRHQRESVHTAALHACRAAFERKIEADTARGPIFAFFERADMLASEILAPAVSAGVLTAVRDHAV